MNSIEDNVKALIPRLSQEVAERIRDEALGNIRYSTSQAITEEVKKYIAENVMPQVRKDLEASSDEIRAAVIAASKGVAELLCAALVESATKKLASYEGDKLLKEVFGPLFRGY
ncbi:MAG TPA: hypothetical protein VFT22_07085 [Kofleriaceae bacterium]|nr:hypothetical protein [Kofleriaceae bacterium]